MKKEGRGSTQSQHTMCKGFEAGSMIKEMKEASVMRMWQAGGKVKGTETSHQESWL